MANDTSSNPETHAFQAEVAELLRLMVHSVYSESDIFLRELISNGSDACDKLRYEAIAAPDLIADGVPPKIRIVPDKKADTLTVIDSGIAIGYSATPAALSFLASSSSSAQVVGGSLMPAFLNLVMLTSDPRKSRL